MKLTWLRKHSCSSGSCSGGGGCDGGNRCSGLGSGSSGGASAAGCLLAVKLGLYWWKLNPASRQCLWSSKGDSVRGSGKRGGGIGGGNGDGSNGGGGGNVSSNNDFAAWLRRLLVFIEAWMLSGARQSTRFCWSQL